MPRPLLLLALAAAPLGAQATRPAPPPAAADTIALSLDEAVRRAERLGEEAGVARAAVGVTEAQVTVARAAGLPQLRLNTTYNRFFENARAQVAGQAFNQPNTYNVNANLSQTLFQGGRIFAGSRAARRFRSAAELTLTETRAQLSLDVQRAYFAALLSDRLTAIQLANLRLATERVTQVQQFASAGRAARYDVLRARVERSNLEPALLEAENARDLAQLELKRLANVPADRPLRLTTTVNAAGVEGVLAALGEDRPLPSRAADGTVAAAPAAPTTPAPPATPAGEDAGPPGGGRATVQAAELNARARRDAITVARADLFPSVSVFVQSGYQAFPLSGSPLRRGATVVTPCPIDPITGVPEAGCRPTTVQNGGFFSDRSLGVQISWPLFDGLRTKGNIDLAQAQARVAELQLAQERERVALEIAQASAELSRARATYAARQQNAGEAGEAFTLASLRFTRGVGTQLDVSDAQLALLTAQTDEARAVYDVYIAAAGLAFAQGRPVPLPGTPAAPTPPARRAALDR
jgi:outer membrane protein TolC